MRKLKILVPLMGLLICVTGYAMASKNVITNIDKPIVVKKSARVFTVSLKSNRTTGYSWFVSKCDHEYIECVSHKYIAPEESIPGAGGVEQFTFKVDHDAFKMPHILSFEMTYARAWDLKNSQVKTIQVVTNDA